MLLRLSVKNFLSFADRQELSLVATSLKGPVDGLIDIPGEPSLKALPCAIIYGANASGKSNFLEAFKFMREAVLHSHNKGEPGGGVPRVPFALDREIGETPSEFEADFIVEGARYSYGFGCTSQRYVAEWLYSYPDGRRRRLFERNLDDVVFGPHLRGQKRAYVDFMRPNSLFIATASQNDHEELSKIASFFKVPSIDAGRHFRGSVNILPFRYEIPSMQIDERIIGFLGAIGTGIRSYRFENKKFPDNAFSKLKNIIERDREGAGIGPSIQAELELMEFLPVLQFGHSGADGREHFFELQSESAGTRRLLSILEPIFSALDTGAAVYIDEINASLHTLVADKIFNLFSDKAINQKHAQLIATTHDTNILNSGFLRRDQIWFCEKDRGGASHLYSLSDFKLRASDDFEKGYLQGRFGAVPFAGNLDAILKAETE